MKRNVKRRGPRPRWTDREKAALRKLYPRAPWAEIFKALPGRQQKPIREQAKKFGIAREVYAREGRVTRAWTPAQNKALRELWPDTSWRLLMRRFRRTKGAIVAQAYALGLEGRWQGYVPVNAAAERCGVHRRTLLKALALYGEHFKRLPSHVRCEEPSPLPRLYSAEGKARRWVVDLDAAERALRFYDGAETMTQAAARLGLAVTTFGDALRRAGVRHELFRRYQPDFWDAALARGNAGQRRAA